METTLTYYHLGSWTVITDAHGEIYREQSFDAWGNSRDPYTWRGTTTTRCMFDRGFTGHEMLYDFGLINMNGRMYDPVMSSFLSPDNYVQSPDYSQSFNRYSYCWNNPLKYTDPSGELIGIDDIIIGAAVGIMFNTTMQFVRGNINSAADMHTAMFVGALSGAAGAWAGGAAAGTFGTFGAAGGGLTGASGSAAGGFVGNACDAWCHGATFGQGFTAGLIGAGMGIAIGGTIGALSGGFSAKWNGGDFWTGKGAVFDQIACSESITTGNSEPVEYSNASAREFSDEYFGKEIKGLNKLYADGTLPSTDKYKYERVGEKVYKYEKVKGGWKEIGVTNGTTQYLGNKTSNVYLYNTAFASKEQLYLTMGHEYTHVWFNADKSLGNPYLEATTKYQDATCFKWEISQAEAWGLSDYVIKLQKSYADQGLGKYFRPDLYKAPFAIYSFPIW